MQKPCNALTNLPLWCYYANINVKEGGKVP